MRVKCKNTGWRYAQQLQPPGCWGGRNTPSSSRLQVAGEGQGTGTVALVLSFNCFIQFYFNKMLLLLQPGYSRLKHVCVILLHVQPNTHTDLKTVLTKKVKTRVTSTAFLPGEFSSQVLQQCSMMNNFRIKDTQTKKPLSIL